MRRDLPERPDLEHLKKQAKDLLDDFHGGKHEGLARVRAGLPAFANASDKELTQAPFALHDAQSVIAREYGFRSFLELREHVDARERSARMAQIMANVSAVVPPAAVLRSMAERRRRYEGRVDLSRALPLLPVRNALVTAGSTAPLHVFRPRTLAALRSAQTTRDNLLAVFAQRDPDNVEPGLSDLHETGCVASIVELLPGDEEGQWVVLQGICWVRLRALNEAADHAWVDVSELAIDAPPQAELAPLVMRLRRDAKKLAARLLPGAQTEKLIEEIDDPLRLSDLVMSNLPGSVEDKARYAAETDLTVRLRQTLALVQHLLTEDPDPAHGK